MPFRFLLLILFLLPAWEQSLASGRAPAPYLLEGPGDRTVQLSVKRFARAFGFDDLDFHSDRIELRGDVHEVVLFRGSRRSMINGSLVWLNEPLLEQDGKWMLNDLDVQNTFRPLLRPSSVLEHAGFGVVVLDPGHGGNDSGALSPTGLQEKEVVLDVAKRIRALLQKQGVTVFLTRHDDRFLELEERPRRADRWKVDVFVSLHANSARPTAQGVETFVLSLPGSLSTNQDPSTPAPVLSYPGNDHNQANQALAYALHHSLRMLPNTVDRGVKRARFSVLRSATAPAALVEMGFLSHPVEGKRFQDPQHRAELAGSIARGIDNYLRAVKTAKMSIEPQGEDNGS